MNNNFSPFPALQSERLNLNKLDMSHAKAIYEYQSNKDNFPYVDMPGYDSIEDARKYIDKMNRGVEQDKWIIWAICLKSTGEIIGTISIWNLQSEESKAELGYGIFPACRREGYMSEALTVVLEYGLKTMELSNIEAYTNHSNKASISFLENMQFKYVNTIEDEYSNNALMDIFVYN